MEISMRVFWPCTLQQITAKAAPAGDVAEWLKATVC